MNLPYRVIDTIEGAGLLVAVLALLVGVLALFVAWHTDRTANKIEKTADKTAETADKTAETAETITRNLNAVAVRLGEDLKKVQAVLHDVGSQVTQQLTQRALDEFPEYLDEIAELVRSAQDRIDICCDHPAYGSFSNPTAFKLYLSAIREKVRDQGKPSMICCMDEELRRISAKDQIDRKIGKLEFSEYKTENEPKLSIYLANHDSYVDFTSLADREMLYGIIENEDNDVLLEFKGATRLLVRTPPPIYFWHIDHTMIFALPGEVRELHNALIPGLERLTEHGYRTRDKDLIRGFRALANKHISANLSKEETEPRDWKCRFSLDEKVKSL